MQTHNHLKVHLSNVKIINNKEKKINQIIIINYLLNENQ